MNILCHVSLVFSFVFLFFLPLRLSAEEFLLYADPANPQVQFALVEITKTIRAKGDRVVIASLTTLKKSQDSVQRLVLMTMQNHDALRLMEKAGARPNPPPSQEGFCIRKTGAKKPTWWLVGADAAGAMYGGLELAEIIQTQALPAVGRIDQNPYLKVRGVKFNIPLDVRTPSYSDMSDAAQNNMAEMWDFAFWREFIDHLARHRFNLISLWNLHPFPSLIRVPEYPDIALDDVRRSTTLWRENYNLNGTGFDAAEIVDNYKVIKRMTLADKVAFWQKVMKYGKERNIDFYIITWNIFVNGTFGQYGITDQLENPTTRDYFRKSVKQLFLAYPDLAGIGLTTGENMYGYSDDEKEAWAFDAYAQGVLDVLKEQPDRKITFVHRQHQTGATAIAEKFAPLLAHPNVNFIFSFKYAQAHVYSSVNQGFHHKFVQDIQRSGRFKTLWTLRNDDVYHFRWGAPDYVRTFIKNMPLQVTEGYYYGSDQYVWGREFMDKNPSTPRQLEIDKHEYAWLLWGRLGYNPEMNNDRLIALLQARFPHIDAAELFSAWQHASMIYPITTGFHWGALDYQWYIEACQSRPDPAQTPSGYHDVNRFITLPPHPGAGYQSIPDYVQGEISGEPATGVPPLAVADQLQNHAHLALQWAAKIVLHNNEELRRIRDDIMSMAYLGNYYAEKIRAAASLALFRQTMQRNHREAALQALNRSAGYWRTYAAIALSNYQNPLWTNRVGMVDWKKTYAYILYDITANGGPLQVPSLAPTAGGVLLEAEDAEYKNATKTLTLPGFTGSGYLENKTGNAAQQITWTFTTPADGNYTLEFRYCLKRQETFSSAIMVNGADVGNVDFWSTGRPGCWAWDRITVTLPKGATTIQLSTAGFVLLDHLNVLVH